MKFKIEAELDLHEPKDAGYSWHLHTAEDDSATVFLRHNNVSVGLVARHAYGCQWMLVGAGPGGVHDADTTSDASLGLITALGLELKRG